MFNMNVPILDDPFKPLGIIYLGAQNFVFAAATNVTANLAFPLSPPRHDRVLLLTVSSVWSNLTVDGAIAKASFGGANGARCTFGGFFHCPFSATPSISLTYAAPKTGTAVVHIYEVINPNEFISSHERVDLAGADDITTTTVTIPVGGGVVSALSFDSGTITWTGTVGAGEIYEDTGEADTLSGAKRDFGGVAPFATGQTMIATSSVETTNMHSTCSIPGKDHPNAFVTVQNINYVAQTSANYSATMLGLVDDPTKKLWIAVVTQKDTAVSAVAVDGVAASFVTSAVNATPSPDLRIELWMVPVNKIGAVTIAVTFASAISGNVTVYPIQTTNIENTTITVATAGTSPTSCNVNVEKSGDPTVAIAIGDAQATSLTVSGASVVIDDTARDVYRSMCRIEPFCVAATPRSLTLTGTFNERAVMVISFKRVAGI